jgi:hypothetical protein
MSDKVIPEGTVLWLGNKPVVVVTEDARKHGLRSGEHVSPVVLEKLRRVKDLVQVKDVEEEQVQAEALVVEPPKEEG